MPAYIAEREEGRGRGQSTVAAFFLILAVALNYLPTRQQQAVAGVLQRTALRPFILTQETLVEARLRSADVTKLRAEIDSLVGALTSLSTQGEENRRLRGLLSLSARLGPSYRAAAVIRPGTSGSESLILLDVGLEHGVRSDAPVLTRDGLIGLVREVRDRTSVGIDWTHPDFRASAMSFDGTAFGMVESSRRDFREEDRLLLDGTAFQTTLPPGTKIVTSGLGGIYPRGIPIGSVVGVAEEDAGWNRSYWLEPFAEPASATHVLVDTSRVDGVIRDLGPAWPRDSILRFEERIDREAGRLDSLTILRDSVAVLLRLLGSAPPDSAGGG